MIGQKKFFNSSYLPFMNFTKLQSILLLMILAAFSCGGKMGMDQSKITRQSHDPDIERLYADLCAGCHGFQLQEFKRLQSYNESEDYLTKLTKNGDEVNGMPAFQESLSDEQIGGLVKYIKEFDYTKNYSDENEAVKKNDYEVIVDDLDIIWSFEFLPDGDILIAEKKGVLSRFSKTDGMTTISGLPPINDGGQGGLLDIALHPDYEENGWLYISYSYIDENNNDRTNTAIIRAQLSAENSLTNIDQIYRGTPTVETRHHYGTKLVFDENNYLFFGNGDRGRRDDFPQKISNSNGKIHRLHDDGRIPADNPFVGQQGAIESIYSYGHRNPQGLTIHPVSKDIWESEHGPRGGDEINIIEPGKNYGWPVISYGINYSGTKFTEITKKDGMEQPVHYYVPSIAPCGMTFLDSDVYPEWKNNLFIGSLRFQYLERIQLYNNQVVLQEKLLEDVNSRVRDVIVGPDGYLYVSVEGPGRILKILP